MKARDYIAIERVENGWFVKRNEYSTENNRPRASYAARNRDELLKLIATLTEDDADESNQR